MEEEEIDFKVEAGLVIEDIGFAVESISISKNLPSSRECVYLNVLTKEHKSLCVELSVLGFRVSPAVFNTFILVCGIVVLIYLKCLAYCLFSAKDMDVIENITDKSFICIMDDK